MKLSLKVPPGSENSEIICQNSRSVMRSGSAWVAASGKKAAANPTRIAIVSRGYTKGTLAFPRDAHQWKTANLTADLRPCRIVYAQGGDDQFPVLLRVV